MKQLALLASIISVCFANILKDSKERYQEGDRYFLFPGDGDGQLHLVDIKAPIDNRIIKSSRHPSNNNYWLFTRSHPTVAEILVYDDVNSIKSSDFNMEKTTVFLVHGWLGNGNNEMNKILTKAFLENDDVNVIVFDWSELAGHNYITAKNGVAALGEGLGTFINWLVSLGASYDRMHLVGFSLGAHIVGNAGRSTHSQVKRITALDPAGPLWKKDANRLKNTNARYVEVIHTNTFMFGYMDPLGDADFYPNGGSSMPGCLINVCSHSKGYEYMADSVKYNNLNANECNNLNDVKRNRCNGDLYPMGNSDLNKSRSGIFRVNTK
ncbi:lipase member H-like [Nymphalis io]|uniref:lipase member H-like n=1 Tax=Inachis io TaxID=171585 RepID=UPI002167C75D|nr:lipase member H-like [Nymphalis io]